MAYPTWRLPACTQTTEASCTLASTAAITDYVIFVSLAYYFHYFYHYYLLESGH